jgi:SAM-dependent methyltransferase
MNSANADVTDSIKRWLKRFPVLLALKRAVLPPPKQESMIETSTLNIVDALWIYAPHSSGTYSDRATVTIKTANRLVPVLFELLRNAGKDSLLATNIEQFSKNDAEVESANTLKTFFDDYGSDKSTIHNYHHLYGPILKNRSEIKAILEIGMGTNFVDVVSNMGAEGTPGASLRAFRDFLPNAQIFGADIDKRILFQEERISTYYVDQLDLATLNHLAAETPNDFDLIIDDGLHSPTANIAVLSFAIKKVRIGGWIVIEDIPDKALPVWHVVSALLPNSYSCLLIKEREANAFAVQRTT